MTFAADRAERLEHELLEEMRDDYVGLWEVARLVRSELGVDDPARVRETTLRIIEQMLMQGWIRAGYATHDGEFEAWEVDPGTALLQIDGRWEGLGRTPTVGDIAWFDLTEWGEQIASTS
jgi:hypothetical protein